ncbi:MAG: NADH-quinone oxidoreductase subunit M [Fibrobacter sp.]|jgi:NADH-quinone oxidoreductase subunit M|nr:NADH-quinone oxidoreductase subunit M [Fibrobacter sp.]
MLETLLYNSIWILPLLTTLLCVPIPREKEKLIKNVHLFSGFLVLGIAVYLTIQLYFLSLASPVQGSVSVLRFVTELPWLQAINAHYFIGADGLSMLMVLLTAVVVFTGMLVSLNIGKGSKEFFALIQILGTSIYGVFMSFDLVLFFIFYEMEAVCMYLMIAGWGSGKKDYGGKKLTLTLALGSAMILAVFFGIHVESGIHSWNILELAQVKLPETFQMWAFPILFMGFAVSGSLFPFHFWSPDGHSAAPTAVSMLAAGVMMKMGTYGILRIAIYLMPEGARFALPYLVYLTIFNVVLAAFIAVRHKDLKYITAYSSISHLGLIFLGIAALTPVSLRGAALQMLSHGFLTALFFAAVGMIYSRTHTRNILEMGGLMKQIPFIGVAFVIAGFAGLGLPGFSGFIAEITIFIGSFENTSPVFRLITILAVLSITTTAIYILQTANRMLNGALPGRFAAITDAGPGEKTVLVLLILCLLGLGLFPAPVSDFLDSSLAPILENLKR